MPLAPMRGQRLRLMPLAILLLAGTTVWAGDVALNPAAPVAVVGQQAISKAELTAYWFNRYPQAYARVLQEFVDERVARDQALGLGLTVPAPVLQAAVAQEVAARERLVREVKGADAGLAAWVREGYGTDVPTWRRTVLLPRLERVLLKQRVVRMHTRQGLRVHARIIVTFDPAKAARILRKLQRGADFSLIALNESEDATSKVGGTLPPISRGDLADFPIVEQRLLAAPPGAVLGPLRVQVDGKAQFQLYKIVNRDEPWRVKGEALLRRLEQDIARHPVTQAELDAWQRHVQKQVGIRYFRPDGSAWR